MCENYRRIAAALGVSYDSLTVAKQTHTSNVKEITMAERGAGVRFPRPYDNVDGIMTNVPGITLVTYHADCLPVYLYDPAHQAIALLHAGWRGTVDNIVSAGLLKMQKAYGTRASDVIAGIGPGISAACYNKRGGTNPVCRDLHGSGHGRHLYRPAHRRGRRTALAT